MKNLQVKEKEGSAGQEMFFYRQLLTEEKYKKYKRDSSKENRKRLPACRFGIGCWRKKDNDHNNQYWHSTYLPPCRYKNACAKHNDKDHMEKYWHSSFKSPCRYGTQCTWKDKEHLDKYWHPRPPCRFGAECYNTNDEHNQKFYHPKK